MPPEVKFCGLMRAEDAAYAAALGARYVGAIFAGGPRELTPACAAVVLAGGGTSVRRVGVFAHADAKTLAAVAQTAALNVIQLHGDVSVTGLAQVRAVSGREIWAVLRVSGSELPAHAESIFSAADAILLDARVEGRLGGTGQTLPWSALAPSVDRIRGSKRIVLAGGLTPDNVHDAVAALRPDVVDVSSGVESAPGQKDHGLMRAFVEAVRA